MIDQVLREANLSLELFDKIHESTSELIYPKNTLVVERGQIAKHTLIVEQGLLRIFYYDERGKDITHWFSSENQLCTVPDSFFGRSESQFYIEALEDVVLRGLTLTNMNNLCDSSHDIERFGRILAITLLSEINNKLLSIQFKTAKERYLLLLEKHPDIFQRVNLGHIASYIGITQQSLSRIRAELQ